MTDGNGGRTHEPGLRELTAQLDGLRDLLDERDLRYEQRFASQERAVEKSEKAQEAINVRSNEFRAALDDTVKRGMARTEVETSLVGLQNQIDRAREERQKQLENSRTETKLLIDGLSKEIDSLRSYRDSSQGGGSAAQTIKANLFSVIGFIISIGALLAAILLKR